MGGKSDGGPPLISNYSYFQNGLFPVPQAVFSLGLQPTELAVYIYLLNCAGWKTKCCYPSFKTIADAVGCSKNTVQKYVRMLEEKCLIYTERSEVVTKKHGVRNGNLIYTIRPIKDAIAHLIAQQERENACRRIQAMQAKETEEPRFVQEQFREEKLPL